MMMLMVWKKNKKKLYCQHFIILRIGKIRMLNYYKKIRILILSYKKEIKIIMIMMMQIIFKRDYRLKGTNLERIINKIIMIKMMWII